MSKWSCFLCKKEFSWEGKSKHLFSKSHQIDLARAILVSKSLWVAWLEKKEKGQKLVEPPSLKVNGKAYHICYPCKSLTYVSPKTLYYPCSCGQMDLQVKKIKEILALDLKVIEEVKKESNPAIEKEKALLEKKINQMTSDVDCLYQLLDWCKEHHPGFLEEVIGDNPKGWKNTLAECAGLEEEED